MAMPHEQHRLSAEARKRSLQGVEPVDEGAIERALTPGGDASHPDRRRPIVHTRGVEHGVGLHHLLAA